MGGGAEGNGVVRAAFLVFQRLGAGHGDSSVLPFRRGDPASSAVATGFNLETSPMDWVIKATVGVRARCRLHGWGSSAPLQVGQTSWGVTCLKSCPPTPLRKRWEVEWVKASPGSLAGGGCYRNVVVLIRSHKDKALSGKALNTFRLEFYLFIFILKLILLLLNRVYKLDSF